VRSLRVVVGPPVLDDFARLADAREPMQVQTFFTEPAIETLDVSVLGRLAGTNEVELDAFVVGPSIKRAAA